LVQEKQGMEIATSFNRRQQLFSRYIFGILVDLTVLNLFDEYWDLVVIEPFTISLLAAALLQTLLKITIRFEHWVCAFFATKPGKYWKAVRLFSAWLILFGSKFLILGAVDLAFGDQVNFGGPLHGIVAFIIVVVAMLVAEIAVLKFNRWLGQSGLAD